MDHPFLYIKYFILQVIAILLISVLNATLTKDASAQDQISVVQDYNWRVIRVFPHDTTAFTQGLIFQDGYLFESTGRRGKSEIRKVCLETGEVVQRQALNDEYFGEGLASWKNKLIQLTLSSGVGFVYDIDTFKRDQAFKIEWEGWGLTKSDQELIMSDGSSTLRFLHPETFKEIRKIDVKLNGKPISKLNELEMIGNKIFANRLFSDEILIIDPDNGKVTGRIDLVKLAKSVESKYSISVLNGIAYDLENNRIFITGKLWPNVYEIKIQSSK